MYSIIFHQGIEPTRVMQSIIGSNVWFFIIFFLFFFPLLHILHSFSFSKSPCLFFVPICVICFHSIRNKSLSNQNVRFELFSSLLVVPSNVEIYLKKIIIIQIYKEKFYLFALASMLFYHPNQNHTMHYIAKTKLIIYSNKKTQTK